MATRREVARFDSSCLRPRLIRSDALSGWPNPNVSDSCRSVADVTLQSRIPSLTPAKPHRSPGEAPSTHLAALGWRAHSAVNVRTGAGSVGRSEPAPTEPSDDEDSGSRQHQLQWIAGASHALPLERPKEVAAAINQFIFTLNDVGPEPAAEVRVVRGRW